VGQARPGTVDEFSDLYEAGIVIKTDPPPAASPAETPRSR
jgi:hypothetical protein